MNERVAVGLHRVYRDRCEQGTVLHGRIDVPSQLREAPGRKDQLHSQYDDLTSNVPCNQVVKTTAESLWACPLLSDEVRAALRQALAGFEGVSTLPRLEQTWEALKADRLPAEYRNLLDLCRLLADSLKLTASGGPMPAPSFLLDLERVFEQHVAREVVKAFQRSSTHKVSVQVTQLVSQPVFDQPNVTMRPDLTIDREGKTVMVIDAKWKRLSGIAETADLYQVLAYGTGLGAEGAALVYPGRRWSAQEHRFLRSPLRLNLFTVQVGGTREKCLRSVRRLVRTLKTLL
jgi:5-methylcytosine-specific restriction enzyme subunit McrC